MDSHGSTGNPEEMRTKTCNLSELCTPACATVLLYSVRTLLRSPAVLLGSCVSHLALSVFSFVHVLFKMQLQGVSTIFNIYWLYNFQSFTRQNGDFKVRVSLYSRVISQHNFTVLRYHFRNTKHSRVDFNIQLFIVSQQDADPNDASRLILSNNGTL